MGVTRPSQIPRTAHTLRLRHLMEERQRLEIADRIRELRERSPYTQPVMADKLGLTLRGYQKIEERGTTKWERCEAIAKILEVDPRWLWDGTEKGASPDPFATSQSAEADAVAALAGEVHEMRRELAATKNELLAELGKVRRAQAAQQSPSKSGGRKRAAKSK